MKPGIITLSLLRCTSKFALAIIVFFVLVACGSGGGGGPVQKTGVFLDAAVSGMGYTTTANLSGMTNGQGEFQYFPGDQVVFSVGNIRLPSVPAADFVTPLDMGTTKDLNDPIVINILRFLQSLDTDKNPGNGISIPPSTVFPNFNTHTLDFGLSVSDFELALIAFLNTLLLNTPPTPVSVESAQAQFEGTVLQQMAGTYSGTFTGDPGGNWRMTINLAGGVSGTIAGERIGQFVTETRDLSGRIESNGKIFFEVIDSNEIFNGNVTLSGTVSGSWSKTGFGESGIFTGNKEATELSFNGPEVPGVYDFTSEDGTLELVYTFNPGNKGTLDFKNGESPSALDWFVDFDGTLRVVFSFGVPDSITLIAGTRTNGTVRIEADDNRDGTIDTIVTGSFVKRSE